MTEQDQGSHPEPPIDDEANPDGTPGGGNGRFALLFSGGLDTTLEVVERLKEYREAHLITFNNGYCINTRGASRRVDELRARYPGERVHHSLVNTHRLIKIILEDFRGLWKEYRSPLLVDMACKMAAVTELVLYARTRGITDLSDGAAVEQTQIFLQHPEFCAHVEPFITSNGLRFLKPLLFDMGREEKIEALEKLGFASGSKILEKLHITSQLAHQPFCMVGFSTFFFTSPLNRLGVVERHSLPIDRAKELWDRLLPRARAHLDERLSDVG